MVVVILQAYTAGHFGQTNHRGQNTEPNGLAPPGGSARIDVFPGGGGGGGRGAPLGLPLAFTPGFGPAFLGLARSGSPALRSGPGRPTADSPARFHGGSLPAPCH